MDRSNITRTRKNNIYNLSLYNEIFDVKCTLKHKLTEDDKARKTTSILIVKSLSKIINTQTIELGLRKHMEKNVVNIFFKINNGKHVGSCNIQYLF